MIKVNTRYLYNYYRKTKSVKSPVEYNVYKDIIIEFHKEISQKILDGYKFYPSSKLGIFSIKIQYRKEVSNKYVDWNKSNKYKAYLLEQGKTLYEEWWELNGEKVDKTTEGAIKVDNGGEKWIFHFKDSHYFGWSWQHTKKTRFTRHIKKYKFIATRFNKRQVNTIKERTDIPLAVYEPYSKED
jgi:hypothetical protein